MPDHPSPTPEGRRCPECGGVTEPPTEIEAREGVRFCPRCQLYAPPAPEGGVPECPMCGTPGAALDTVGRVFICPNVECDRQGPFFATPTSAEGGVATDLWPGRCKSVLDGRRCGMDAGHEGDHSALIPTSAGWKSAVAPVWAQPLDKRHDGAVVTLSPTPAATGEEDTAARAREIFNEGDFDAVESLLLNERVLRRQLAEAEAKRPMTHPGPYCAWCGATARPRDYFCSDSCRESWADNGGDDDQ